MARFHGLLLSLSLKAGNEKSVVGLKRIKKANPNPNIRKNKTTKNGKTSSATPIIMEKYFPYDSNTRKNNKNLKFNNKIEIAVISVNWGDGPLVSQYIDAIIGKEYAPTSISNKKY